MINTLQDHINALLTDVAALPPTSKTAHLRRIISLATDTANLEAIALGNQLKRIKLGRLLIEQQRLLALLSEKGRLERWQLSGFSELEKTVSLSVGQGLIQVTPDLDGRQLFEAYELVPGNECLEAISNNIRF